MLRRFALAALVLTAASCNGGPGDTSAAGSVTGVSFVKPTAIFNTKSIPVLRDQLAVVISDDPDACAHLQFDGDNERPYLLLPDGSHEPSLWMRMTDHSTVLTDLRGIGEDLHASFDPGAPVGAPCGVSACESTWISADRGTADINSSADPGQADSTARGDYALNFSGDQISGDFDAKPCGNLKVSGCTVAGGALAPGLALLGLALLKRRPV